MLYLQKNQNQKIIKGANIVQEEQGLNLKKKVLISFVGMRDPYADSKVKRILRNSRPAEACLSLNKN